jgi:prevent-host-death family protein
MWQCFTHNICNIKDHSNRRSSERKHNGAVNPKEHRKMVLGAFETLCERELYSSNRGNGEFMAAVSAKWADSIVVSALSARSNFGKLLRRVDVERRSLVIEKRGTPTAVLMNLRDYVKLAAPEPEVLKIIGQEAKQNRTSQMTSRQIDQVIKASRAQRRKS